MSLQDLVHRFKSLTTARYRQGIVTGRWHALDGKLWQRNYYELIIRHERELQTIREYIATNPVRWETDWENILGAQGRAPAPALRRGKHSVSWLT
jgi:REP element-mobilizing transposase RayT